MTSFTIYGECKGKKRPRANVIAGHAHIYNDKDNVTYESHVINSYKQQCGDAYIEKNIEISASITAYFAIPKATSKKKTLLMENGTILPTKKPDLDNIAKTVLDGLNSIAYYDDSQITMLLVTKRYGKPRVEVSLTAKESQE